MKITKIMAALLVLCLLVSMFVACDLNVAGNDYGQQNDANNSNVNQDQQNGYCTHSWESASCEKPKTCSLCSATEGSALGHTTTTGKCTRCEKNFGAWELGEFVDEFKQPTGEKYISTQVSGTFSNSATTNSNLIAILQVTSEDVAIMLWEYGSHSVKCSYKWDEYSITMMDANGNKYYLNGTMYSGSSRIYFEESDESTVINALNQTGSVSFYIVLSDITTTNYLFTVECSNFKELYSQIK